VVDQLAAERSARAVLGVEEFRLEEFPEGWQVLRAETVRRGSGTLVVERDTGEVRMFPSAIAPRRLLSNYSNFRHLGAHVA
jgi:hypothetical protein